MGVSIITVAKSRKDLTKISFESIWDNAHQPENIEHLVGIDCNDNELIEYGRDYIEKYSNRNIQFFKKCWCKNPDEYVDRNIHRDYWNPLAKICTHDVIFGMPNDCIIQTKHFDKIMVDAFNENKKKYNHKIFQILINDGWRDHEELRGQSQDYCSWVILTKDAVHQIDGIVPNEIKFSGGDTYVYSIFNQTPIKSQIDLTSQISTKHVSHYDGVSPYDNVTSSKPAETMHDAIVNIPMLKNNFYHFRVNSAILLQHFDNQLAQYKVKELNSEKN